MKLIKVEDKIATVEMSWSDVVWVKTNLQNYTKNISYEMDKISWPIIRKLDEIQQKISESEIDLDKYEDT